MTRDGSTIVQPDGVATRIPTCQFTTHAFAMRSADERRTLYFQTQSKALATADSLDAAEIVRLQAEAVALATGWAEFQELADTAIKARDALPRASQDILGGDMAHSVSADIHHE